MSAQTRPLPASDNAPKTAIELKSISKSFGHVQANKDISLKIQAGTIHGIIGENGAGKSTLMNILYGLHPADSGEIHIDGKPASIRGSAQAIELGIGMVHQHFMLVPPFSVLENVMLGSEGGAILAEGREKTRAKLKELEDRFGLSVDPDALIQDLPVGLRQRVEIIKALKSGAEILILDEPTGVLTPQETESLFAVLQDMKSQGVTILLITHKLEEIMAITDNVSIMRRGQMVGHRKTSETNAQDLAELMVGRAVLLNVDAGEPNPGEVRLAVKGINAVADQGHATLKDISFEVRAGEILGVAGVSGNGQTELLEILSGMASPASGSIDILGNQISADQAIGPRAMRDLGVGHIPEDRHHHGLVLDYSAMENMVLGFEHKSEAGEGLFMSTAKMRNHCQTLMDKFDVRPPRPGLKAKNFSGGNQQKIVIAREMYAEPQVLLVGQPTRGVDVGAIEFIHNQLIALRNRGCAIVLVSVELEEIMSLADRIMVMNEGRNIGIVTKEQADEKTLGLMMAGINEMQETAK